MMPRPLIEIEDLDTLRLKGTLFADGQDKHGLKTHLQVRVNEEFGVVISDSCSNRKWTRTITTVETGDRAFTLEEFREHLKSLKEAQP